MLQVCRAIRGWIGSCLWRFILSKRTASCFEKTLKCLRTSDNFSIVCGNEQNHKKLESLFINLGTNLTLQAYSEVLLENRMINSKLEVEKIWRSSTIRLASLVALAAVSCLYGMDEKKAALTGSKPQPQYRVSAKIAWLLQLTSSSMRGPFANV